jgi:hypothetical protein
MQNWHGTNCTNLDLMSFDYVHIGETVCGLPRRPDHSCYILKFFLTLGRWADILAVRLMGLSKVPYQEDR